MNLPVRPGNAGHRARKRFGQNFLHDTQVISKIVQLGRFKSTDHVIEIGPGLGALTQELIKDLNALTVIEIDRDLAAKLPLRVKSLEKLTVIEADALSFDFSQIEVDETNKLRIIGNLPYNISTPLLFHLLQFNAQLKDMHFMLQKEVVDRITAAPGSHDYGRLSVMIQYSCEPEYLLTVAPESFDPTPKVTSAVFRLTPYTQKPITAKNEQHFGQLVARLFSQRRKTIRSQLKNTLSEAQILSLGLDPMARPETLTVTDFVKLSDLINEHE